MQARYSQEVFTVASVSKQSRKGSGNVSYLYGLKRANGQEKEGRYHREQLQIVPEMRTKWNPGPSKGRAFIDKLRAENVISGWDSKHKYRCQYVQLNLSELSMLLYEYCVHTV